MSHTVSRAFISFRIGTPLWMPEERFRETLSLLEEHRGVTDEVTFFTSETHPPLPLPVIEERVALLARRMPEVRRLGYRTGINVLSTVGHHNENLPNSLSGNYTPMTDIDGSVCRGSFCPNDERLREYIRRLYELVAMAEPDYLWIDDDVRLWGHMPIRCGCFCDTCLALFAQESGTRYTRDSLRQALGSGPLEGKLALRRAWLQHNRETMARLFRLIEETVHRVKPGLPLGFMTGERYFEGYDFDAWAAILAGPEGAEVLWRPGGGFYSDEALAGLIGKAHDIGRQVSLLPESVRCIESEIENFPYQRLKKSARTTALEAAAHIAAGCTGAAFNVLSMYDEPLDEYRPLVAHLRETRPFLDLLVRTFGRYQPVGLHTGWGKETFAAGNAVQGDWFESSPWSASAHAAEVLEIGIPVAYSPGQARVTALSGESAYAMTDEEIRRILSGGALLDAQALEALNALGYEELTGYRVERFVHEDCIEVLTGHPLNGEFAGRRRDGRQSFWKCPAAVLVPTQEGAQALARMVDYGDREVAACCQGVFENRLGGRVGVAGYYPWLFLQSLSKSTQVKRLLRWLSRETLPGFVATFHKATLWLREPESGLLAAAVLNASLDPAEGLTLLLRTPHEQARVYDMQCRETTITASGVDGPYRRFVLPPIGAWEMRIVVAQ